LLALACLPDHAKPAPLAVHVFGARRGLPVHLFVA
jgi:hypothetical protein